MWMLNIMTIVLQCETSSLHILGISWETEKAAKYKKRSKAEKSAASKNFWKSNNFAHLGRCRYVAGAGVREGCKNFGWRGGFGGGPNRWFSRSRRRDFVLCDVDVWSFRRWIRGKAANISRYGNVTLQGSFRVAITGIRMPWLNFFVASAVLLKHSLKKNTETYCNSEVKCLVHMSFLREVSQKRCDFQFLGLIFDVWRQSPFTPCVIGQDVQAPCRAPGLLTVICDPAGGLDEQPMNQQIL